MKKVIKFLKAMLAAFKRWKDSLRTELGDIVPQEDKGKK